jgi:glycosyltransferase involved in cell wall biosynthesis
MKVLVVHNNYGENAMGGEAMVFNAEVNLLKQNDIETETYERTNSELHDLNLYDKLKRIKNIHWSEETIKNVGNIMDQFKPDILHVHNYKYVITPSVFQAAKDRGIKTVLTLHNYRLIVPCGNFMTKEGKVCEKCLTGSPAKILYKRCTQGSLGKSFLQYRLYNKTRYELNQLVNLVDNYIVLSKFAKTKLISTGVPEEKVKIKPNFIDSKTISSFRNERAVFIGRLSFEKGLLNLISMWRNFDYPLFIIGTGPLLNEAQKMASENSNIIFLGGMKNLEVKKFLAESAFMVFPSTLYEGMPLTILEAMSVGTPVLASNLGPRNEIIENGINGILYNVNDRESFIKGAESLIFNTSFRKELGTNGLNDFHNKYTERVNFKIIKKIYTQLVDDK